MSSVDRSVTTDASRTDSQPATDTDVDARAGVGSHDDAAGADSATRRLAQVDAHSIDAHRVEGRIEAVDPGPESVTLTVRRLTDDVLVEDDLAVPHPWDATSRLARLLDARGYGAGAVELLVDEPVVLRAAGGTWRVDPERGSADALSSTLPIGRVAALVTALAIGVGLLPIALGGLVGVDGLALGLLGAAGAAIAVLVVTAAILVLGALVVVDRTRRRLVVWRRRMHRRVDRVLPWRRDRGV